MLYKINVYEGFATFLWANYFSTKKYLNCRPSATKDLLYLFPWAKDIDII